jgi:hypothetical protein
MYLWNISNTNHITWFKDPRSESISVKGLLTNNMNSENMKPKKRRFNIGILKMKILQSGLNSVSKITLCHWYEHLNIFGALNIFVTQTKNEWFNKWVPNAKECHIKIFVTVNRTAVHNVTIFTEAQLYSHIILQAVTSISSSSVKEISFTETTKKTNS